MAKKEKGTLTKIYEKAKKALGDNNHDLARDYFDFGIVHIAHSRFKGNMSVDDKIENVKVGVCLERFWYGLENNNLLL